MSRASAHSDQLTGDPTLRTRGFGSIFPKAISKATSTFNDNKNGNSTCDNIFHGVIRAPASGAEDVRERLEECGRSQAIIRPNSKGV
ncbi:hypothetical protein M404DRAFT_1008061 [Pisolithus tinctorius Marx 270]|uniref:Uncharacterized protein n=1 Tax=Pisolithus tinctorius Marx 270 TaxID=870435 RepID=A0A0C3NH38_PISTI|nr:hypothetical protein M404DRAFT_1008061 [Pisolithus tinctorius Marx 270]